MIDVSWCVSADHGGIPQFRLCDDEGLVSAVTTPDKPPSLADLEALEQCFQRGLLRCDDVDGNDCSQVEVCGEYAADWGACADKGKTRASRPPRWRRVRAATAATGTRSRSRASSSGPTSATRLAPENGA